MRSLRIIILTVAVALGLSLSAQTDPLLSQHYAVPSFYNPAAAGSTDLLRLRAGGRMQWVGIDNAPTTFLGAADMPLSLFGKKIGVGAVAMQESMGLYSTLSLGAQVAYKLRFAGGTLSVGLQLGMFDEGFKGSEVYLPDDDDFHQGADDALPTTDVHGTAFDMGAGVFYSHKYFTAGISCTHLMSPTLTLRTSSSSSSGVSRAADGAVSGEKVFQYEAARTLYFQAEGNIPVKNTLFEVLPSVLIRSDFTFTDVAATVRARYNKMFSAGIGYRYGDAVSLMLGAELKGIFIGYSYDYHLSDIAKASSGSHEIFAGYNLKLDFSEKNRNKHKSIRIM